MKLLINLLLYRLYYHNTLITNNENNEFLIDYVIIIHEVTNNQGGIMKNLKNNLLQFYQKKVDLTYKIYNQFFQI